MCPCSNVYQLYSVYPVHKMFNSFSFPDNENKMAFSIISATHPYWMCMQCAGHHCKKLFLSEVAYICTISLVSDLCVRVCMCLCVFYLVIWWYNFQTL